MAKGARDVHLAVWIRKEREIYERAQQEEG
jgi:hypothetical protein